MRNYALQKGPCNFLDLRISPWGIPFLLLLCSSSLTLFYPLWRLSPSLVLGRRWLRRPGALLPWASGGAQLRGQSERCAGAARLQAGARRRGSRRVRAAPGSGGARAARLAQERSADSSCWSGRCWRRWPRFGAVRRRAARACAGAA
jgi:hypothetical protein